MCPLHDHERKPVRLPRHLHQQRPWRRDAVVSRDLLQSFKNEIYDIGVDIGASYYRFGGMMKGYIRRAFGDALVDRHLAMKRAADPAMILNRDVIF